MKRLGQTVYVELLKGNVSLKEGLTKLKYQGDMCDNQQILEKISSSKTKAGMNFRKLLFPNSYNQLFKEFLVYDMKCSLEKELYWGQIILCTLAKEINLFLELRRRYENYLMCGKYEEAECVLKSIKSQLGCSFWSMEQEFLLSQLRHGLKENKQLLNEMNTQISHSWVRGFADFFSMKVERNLNMRQYIMRIDRRLSRLDDSQKLFFKMHLLIEINDIKADWQQVLKYASYSSAIDYFINYCKVCSYIISNNPTENKQRKSICAIAEKMSLVIPEPMLKKMAFKGEEFKLSQIEKQLQKIGVEYTEGNYSCVIENCKELLEDNANVFELYEYYIKSCIIGGEVSEFQQRTELNSYLHADSTASLKDTLLNVLYAVYRKGDDFEIAYDEHRVLMRYLSNFYMAPELCNFYLKKVAYYVSDSFKNYLEYQAQYHNMRSSFLYKSELKEKYFSVFKQECGDSSLLALYRNTQSSLVESMREKWYQIKRRAESGNYKEALQGALELCKCDTLYVKEYLKEDLLLFIFEMKTELGLYEDVLEMFVDIYLENHFMTCRINAEEIFDKIQKHTNENVKKSMAMPIFSAIVNQEASCVYGDYANFMDNNGILRPLEIIEKKLCQDKRRLVYFLRNVCTTDVLDSMYLAYENQEEILQERLQICQTLREIDSDNDKLYIEEIGNITQRQNLSNDIRYLEEQKIDFDMERIHSKHYDKFNENFKRYKEIGNIWQDIQGFEGYDLQTGQKIVFYTYISEDSEQYYSYDKYNQKFGMFNELFIELRDEVNFGPMGLDQSLGTRIRHGRLQNQIRRVFEEKNMIFIKKNNQSSEYVPINERTFEMLFNTDAMSPEQITHLKRIISEFTQNIDAIVIKANRDYIRIKTENDYPEGIINMIYDSEDIQELFNEGADFDNAETMMELFEKSIVNRIRIGLQQLGELFRNEIKQQYVNELYHLEQTLNEFYSTLNLETTFGEIRSNLVGCRTEIQTELESISQWFSLPTSQAHPDYHMKDLLELCKATMKNINTRYEEAQIQITNNTDSYWRGKTFSYFNEILIILFNNAFTHTGYRTNIEGLEIDLKLSESDCDFKLEMYTNLADDVNKNELKEKILSIKEQLYAYGYSTRGFNKDSGSGYIKIYHMLRNHIVPQGGWKIDFGLQDDECHFYTMIEIARSAIKGEEHLNGDIID